VATLHPIAQGQTHHRTAIQTTPNAGVNIFNARLCVTADPKLPDFSRNERAFSSAPVFF